MRRDNRCSPYQARTVALWSASRINKMKGITMEQISFTTVRQLDLICQKLFPIDTSHDWNHLPFRERN